MKVVDASRVWGGMGVQYVVVLGAICLSAAAWAEEGADVRVDVRGAGSEAKFRVIERFSGAGNGAGGRSELPSALGLSVRPALPAAIAEAIAEEKWDVAALLLDKTGVEDPAEVFLAGYLDWRAGRPAEALAHFDVDESIGLLEDYRLYFGGRAAFDAGDYHRAALYAAGVPADSLLFGRSLMLMGESLLETGTSSDLERAVLTGELYLRKYASGRSAREARWLLARAHEASGAWESAAEAYEAVIREAPLSSEAAEAGRRLEVLGPKLSDGWRARIANPPPELRLRRYRALFEAHRSRSLVDELSGDLEAWAQGSEERCEALYMIAKSHTKMRAHEDGGEWYQRLLEECEEPRDRLRALYLGGRGFWNTGKRAEAKAWFERIWTEHPEHSFADDAMYFTARILRTEGREAEANAQLRAQVEAYPSGDMAKDAHWLLVRQMLAAGEHREAVEYVDGLEGTGEDDLYSEGRLAYFGGRALEAQGSLEQALGRYRQVASDHPLSYYGLLALNGVARLDARGAEGGRRRAGPICAREDEKACEFLPRVGPGEITIDEGIRGDAHFARGVELVRLGLRKLAEGEFREVRGAHAGDETSLWSLAYLLDAAGGYPISHDIPRRHIEGWRQGYPLGAGDAQWRVAFPTPFERLVVKAAREQSLDPALIWAIMREESGFEPTVESWARARGLLQLMTATAESVAGSAGVEGYEASRLFEPEVNIAVGAAYMRELADQLEGHPALVIAGYNGGYANVARWLSERGELALDLWVEDIPYGQTRKYTKRVLASYWTYKWLYGESRVPRLGFELPK